MFESVRLQQAESASVIVIGLFKDRDAKADLTQFSALFGDTAVSSALQRREWTGDAGSIVEAFPQVETRTGRALIVGLGKRDKLNAEMMRDIAAKVGRRLAQIKEPSATLDVAQTLRAADVDATQLELYGRCWGESLGLLAWKARMLEGSAAKRKTTGSEANGSEANKGDEDRGATEPIALTVSSPDAAFTAGLEFGLQLAASANRARTLSQTPPNIATPLYIAAQAQQLAQETGLECRVIQGEELEREHLAGLLNVGKASANPPCMIRLEYHPNREEKKKRRREEEKTEKEAIATPEHLKPRTPEDPTPEHPTPNTLPLVLIGKTITYDTGGLTLKINNGMVGMKRDKDGGCAVLGAMHAIATLLKPNFPVVGLLVAAENMISEAAFRPDDVLTYRNGVTVEVTNTDAEGRLVLADALCWACDVENPGAIVDLATLTGGVVTALGSTYAGLFCEDARFRGILERASEQSGERLWRLPLHQEYRDLLKSPVADIINSNPNRKAHPIQGAAFLSYFVTEGMPWAHIDIAGVHAVDGDSGPFVKGPTGFGVRLLADLIAAYAADH